MIFPLQGLRLLGIITIIAGHAGLSLWGGGDWCSFFFILSGFLYKTDVSSLNNYGQYLWKKAKSIYPVYWFCLVSYIGLAFIRGCKEQYDIGLDIIPHLLLIQSWIPSIQSMAYLAPAWFLSSLLFCYSLSPVAKKIVDYSHWTIVGIIILYVLWVEYNWGNTYISPLYRLLEYSFGIWLHSYATKKIYGKEIFPGFNIVCVILSLALIRIGLPAWVEILLFGTLITNLASFSSTLTEHILGNRLIVELAKADMFIYLTHPGIAFHFVMFFFGHNVWAMLVGSVIVGYIMYLVYEYLKKLSLPIFR